MENSLSLPDLVRQANRLPYEYGDGDGIDYEALDTFLSPVEMQRWFRAWTGNEHAESSCFRVFGQDGTGGYAAFWLIRDDPDVMSQPIVFLGSEGEIGIIARNFRDYLWLLAAGLGPYEAACSPNEEHIAQPALTRFAELNAGPFKKADQVLAEAHAEFPDFEQFIESQCR